MGGPKKKYVVHADLAEFYGAGVVGDSAEIRAGLYANLGRSRARRMLRDQGVDGLSIEETWNLYMLATDNEELAAAACEERAVQLLKEACDGNHGQTPADSAGEQH